MRPLQPLSIETAIALSSITPYRAAASPPRRVLLVGHNGVDNVGADLRTELAIRLLKGTAPEIELWMTTYDAPLTHGQFAGAQQHHLPLHGQAELWRLVSLCDAVLVTEGCALSEAGFGQFAGALALARSQGKPAVAWAVGADCMPTHAIQWLKRYCAGTLFLCRDERSMRILGDAGFDARLGADPVWSTVPAEPTVRRRRRSSIAICASSLGAWPAEHRWRFDGWIAMLDQLARSTTEEILLLSLDNADIPYAEKLAARTGAKFIRVKGQKIAEAAFGSARVVVSARFHGFILAAVYGARAIGVALDSRMSSLVEGSQMAVSVVNGTAPDLSERLANLISDRAGEFGQAAFIDAERDAIAQMNAAALEHLALPI